MEIQKKNPKTYFQKKKKWLSKKKKKKTLGRPKISKLFSDFRFQIFDFENVEIFRILRFEKKIDI